MKTITLYPGDELTIKVADRRPQPIQDLEGRHVLPVPYISQNGPGANHAPGDCGPACVAMAIHFLTDHEPTVNQVSLAGGIVKGARWSTMEQNTKAARHYDLQPKHVRPLTIDQIEKEIKAGFPILALVKYDLLATDEDPNQSSFNGAHFVLIVGFSPRTIIIHDPNRLTGEKFGEFREIDRPVFAKAHGSTAKTSGNSRNFHGVTFYA